MDGIYVGELSNFYFKDYEPKDCNDIPINSLTTQTLKLDLTPGNYDVLVRAELGDSFYDNSRIEWKSLNIQVIEGSCQLLNVSFSNGDY